MCFRCSRTHENLHRTVQTCGQVSKRQFVHSSAGQRPREKRKPMLTCIERRTSYKYIQSKTCSASGSSLHMLLFNDRIHTNSVCALKCPPSAPSKLSCQVSTQRYTHHPACSSSCTAFFSRLQRTVAAARAAALHRVEHAARPVLQQIGHVADRVAVGEQIPSPSAVAVVVEP